MSLDAAKLAALESLPGALFDDHVRTRGVLSDDGSCWCCLQGADVRCEVGTALLAIRVRSIVKLGDRERIP